MNNVSIIGRLGQDPELRYSTDSRAVVVFAVAVENRFRSDGRPDWVTVEVWGTAAETFAEHKSQGDQVGISGRLTHKTWETEAGEKHAQLIVTAQDIQFLARKRHTDPVPKKVA